MTANLKCPRCGGEITRGEPTCAHCGVLLKWRNPLQKGETKGETASAGTSTVRPPPESKQNAGVGDGARCCPQCGKKLEAGQRFCPECGARVAGEGAAEGPWRCRACGAEMGAEARFCTACGAAKGAAGRPGGAPRTPQKERPDARNYDAAVRIGQEIESHVERTAWGIWGNAPLPFLCFVWHELLIFVIVSCVAMVAAASYRQAVRNCLKGHDVAGAKSALGPAKGWFWVSMISSLVAWAIVLGRFWMVLQHFK